MQAIYPVPKTLARSRIGRPDVFGPREDQRIIARVRPAMEGKPQAQRLHFGGWQQQAVCGKIVKLKSHGHKIHEKLTELFPSEERHRQQVMALAIGRVIRMATLVYAAKGNSHLSPFSMCSDAQEAGNQGCWSQFFLLLNVHSGQDCRPDVAFD